MYPEVLRSVRDGKGPAERPGESSATVPCAAPTTITEGVSYFSGKREREANDRTGAGIGKIAKKVQCLIGC